MAIKAAIIPVGSKFGAQILYENALEPVEFFRRTEDRQELRGWLMIEFPGLDIITQQMFQMELDHIKLFGCRWDDEDIVLPPGEVDEQMGFTRISDEDILAVLNDADEELDRVDEKLHAVLPSPLVDD